MPLKIFFCYAREDKALRDELEKHLGALKRSGQVTTWYDREIQPGTDWAVEIEMRLNTADIVLLLVSPDFIHSDYCWGVEMQRAVERYKAGEARVIPIILRPVYWKGTLIGELQLLPTEGKAITRWTDRDEAFEDVVRNLSEVVQTLLFQKAELARRVLYSLELPVEHQKIYLNETLLCRDCGSNFVFTTEEQEFYSSRVLRNKPGRCPSCRAIRRNTAFTGGRRSEFTSRQMYTVTCAGCGIETQIPLIPKNDRPIYCFTCYSTLKTPPAN